MYEVEQRCSKDNEVASKARSQAELYEAEQLNILNNQKMEIDTLAEKKIESTIMRLEQDNTESKERHRKHYAVKYASKESWHVLAFTFCIVWSIIQALSSNCFRGEVVKIFLWIGKYISDRSINVSAWTVAVAEISDFIPNSILSGILYWVIWVIVWLLLFLLFYIIPLLSIFCGCYIYFKSKSFDKVNRWIMIGSSMIFIAFASEVFNMQPINLIKIWVIVQIAVPIIRYIGIPLIRLLFKGCRHLVGVYKKQIYWFLYGLVLMILMWGGLFLAACYSFG